MNGQIDEMVSIAKALTPANSEKANVIIDFADKKVLKCLIEGKDQQKDFDELRTYYQRVYPNLITQLEREAPITKKQESLSVKHKK